MFIEIMYISGFIFGIVITKNALDDEYRLSEE